MTREEAIEELERLLLHWDDLQNGKRSYRWYSKDAVEVALTALRPVSREQVERVWRGEWKPTEVPYMNEWISVEERLPTDEHPVLVFVGYADTMTGFITTSSYFCFDENPHWQWDGLVRDEQRTLFWMPLPAPPDRRPPERQEELYK